MWCVVVCDLEASLMKRPGPTVGCCAQKKNIALLCLLLFSRGKSKGYGFHYVRFDSRQETYVAGFVMCGCFDNCVGVLVICVLVFTVNHFYLPTKCT